MAENRLGEGRRLTVIDVTGDTAAEGATPETDARETPAQGEGQTPGNAPDQARDTDRDADRQTGTPAAQESGGDTGQGGGDAPDTPPPARAKGKKAGKKAAAAGSGDDEDDEDLSHLTPRQRRKRKADRSANRPTVIEVPPAATPARMRRRHWGLLFAFLLVVGLPLAGAGWYLWTRAVDQYGSVVGFTVRKEEGTAAVLPEGLTGLLGGSGGSSDSDILYEFIQSQSVVARIDDKLDLISIYSEPHETDPVFALDPEATIEDLTDYWSRMVRLSYDQSSGLMELRVLAFNANDARDVARAIVDESQQLINELNATARSDTLRYAEEDLATAEERLREAREALTLYRTRTQIVDPEGDIQTQNAVISNLQQQLAQALIEYDLLAESTSETDPRVVSAERRIEVIRDRIDEEREASVVGEDYPALLAEYESLIVDREFAEESYRAALAGLDAARANASRQTRYLAAYVEPTLPQTAEYPRRPMLFGLAALFLFLAWAIVSLVYYSIRDSR